LASLDRLKDAEAAYLELIEQKMLGPQDNYITHHKCNSGLARVYFLQGRLAKAIASYRECYKNLKLCLGESHPFTLESMIGLALALKQSKYLEESMDLYQMGSVLMKQVFGDAHPSTVACISSMEWVRFEVEAQSAHTYWNSISPERWLTAVSKLI
jgi:tetratricopeptide (TPR) repeat protein